MTKEQHLVVITIRQETKEINHHFREVDKTGTRIEETAKVVVLITHQKVETETIVIGVLITVLFRNHQDFRINNTSNNASTRTSPGPTVTTRTQDTTIGT